MADSLKDITDRLDKMRKDRDWDKFHSLNNLAISLNLEASEVLEKFQWNLDRKITKKEKEEMYDELSDVFINIIFFMLELDKDLIELTNKKIDKIEMKYPIDKVKGISKREMYASGKIIESISL